MKRTHFLQKKLDFEKEFQAWADADPARKAKYGDILAKEKEQYKVIAKTKDRDNVFGIFGGLSGTISAVARQIYNISKEMQKPVAEREPGFTEEACSRSADGMKYAYNDYYEPLDKALMERGLKMAAALPEGQRITGLEHIFTDKSKSIKNLLTRLMRRPG